MLALKNKVYNLTALQWLKMFGVFIYFGNKRTKLKENSEGKNSSIVLTPV